MNESVVPSSDARNDPQEEILRFLDDPLLIGADEKPCPEESWRILIVDDEQSVHYATSYALSSTVIDGRPLDFLHAYSAKEALDCLTRDPAVAVMLLDVVMEHENAGLELVRVLRTELNLHTLRIILRTGQPGYAPEAQVIRDYDINDYKLKSELTQTSLVTALTSAIRSYDQICRLMTSRRGLAEIIESSNDLYSSRTPADFAAKVQARLELILGREPQGMLFCAPTDPHARTPDAPTLVIAAGGVHARFANRPLSAIDDRPAADAIAACLRERRSSSGPHGITQFLGGAAGQNAVIHLSLDRPLNETEKQLFDVFLVSVNVGLQNICLIDDLHHLAFRDPLTGLLNRKAFVKAIDSHPNRDDERWTVALLDVDHFAEVNDALGHALGDALLDSVSKRLQAYWHEPSVLARVGADVFGVFAPDSSLEPERLSSIFHETISVEHYRLAVTVTTGLTRLAEQRGSGDNLFRMASTALKLAKSEGRGECQYHTREMSEAASQRLALLSQLRTSLQSKRGFELHYQPQVDLANGALVGVEALLRWTDEDGRPVPPDRFIGLAENAGLMVELGEWIFRTGVGQLKQWEADRLPPIRMAINLSLAQFRDPSFADRLIGILDESRIPPAWIELEITESMAMGDVDKVIRTLAAFRSIGIEVAVDDFGTGFSSLSYLHRLPVNRLKIDRSFVNAMSVSGGSGNKIADQVIQLGHSLGLSVIAEGIETDEQATLLREMGCDLGQGFLFSKPLPARALVDWEVARSGC